MDEIRNSIRHFIASECLAGSPVGDLADDTPLQTSGILDSLAVMSLVGFLNRQFAVELDIYETSVERFDCIADIARTVEAKRPRRQIA